MVGSEASAAGFGLAHARVGGRGELWRAKPSCDEYGAVPEEIRARWLMNETDIDGLIPFVPVRMGAMRGSSVVSDPVTTSVVVDRHWLDREACPEEEIFAAHWWRGPLVPHGPPNV